MFRTDYKNDKLLEEANSKRRFRVIENADGTVSFEDVTEYEVMGDHFGADEVNAIHEGLNGLIASDNTKFRFGVNEDGEYGYIITGEDGADSVVPFSNAKKLYEALQYSGLVTEDMTYDQICEVLCDRFPEVIPWVAYNGETNLGDADPCYYSVTSGLETDNTNSCTVTGWGLVVLETRNNQNTAFLPTKGCSNLVITAGVDYPVGGSLCDVLIQGTTYGGVVQTVYAASNVNKVDTTVDVSEYKNISVKLYNEPSHNGVLRLKIYNLQFTE